MHGLTPRVQMGQMRGWRLLLCQLAKSVQHARRSHLLMSDHPKAWNFKLRVRKHRYPTCLCVQMELTVYNKLMFWRTISRKLMKWSILDAKPFCPFSFFVKKKLRRSSSQRGEFTKFSLQGSLVQKKNRERTQDLIKLLSFFYPTNVNWKLDQTKKTQRSPAGDRTRVFRLPVGCSNHWATKPQQELRANFCLSPTVSSFFLFFFTTRWPECSSLPTRRDQRNTRVTSWWKKNWQLVKDKNSYAVPVVAS